MFGRVQCTILFYTIPWNTGKSSMNDSVLKLASILPVDQIISNDVYAFMHILEKSESSYLLYWTRKYIIAWPLLHRNSFALQLLTTVFALFLTSAYVRRDTLGSSAIRSVMCATFYIPVLLGLLVQTRGQTTMCVSVLPASRERDVTER